MRATSEITAPATGSDYRRHARRIRALHRNDPVETQLALRTLIAGRAPQSAIINPPKSKFDWSDSAILGHRTPLAREFADQVAVQLLNGILPCSNRRSLLAGARKSGISKFEASLIIAAVEHRMKQPLLARHIEARRLRLNLPATVVILVALELTALIALVRLFA